MKLPILTLGVPNKNGRVYNRHIVEKALAELPVPLVIQRGIEPDGLPTLAHTIGEAKTIAIEGEQVVAVCEFLGPEAVNWAEQVEKGILHVVPAGVGNILQSGEVSDYTISYLFLTTDPA